MVRHYEGAPQSRTDIIIDVLMQITELYPTEHSKLDPIINKLLTQDVLSDTEKQTVKSWLHELAIRPDR